MAQLPDQNPARYEGQDLEALADLPRYHRWILETFRPHLRGRSLEVGAGIGNFSKRYIQDVDEAYLLEPAKNLVPQLRTRFEKLDHVTVIPGLLEDWCNGTIPSAPAPTPGSFDCAVMVNVLEHVEDDLAMVSLLQQLLRPGGALLLFVPAMRLLYGTLDAMVHHYRRYTRSRIRRILHRCDLELRSLSYFDLLGTLPWFVAGRVLKQRQFNSTMATVYDRFLVPITSHLERWIKLPLGKNLICVAQKAILAEERRAA